MDTSVRVLLVDDEPGIRHVLGALIRDFGYDVHTAESAREALEAFTANPFPIVVTDIRMPGMDGLALLERVRNQNPDTQVVMITGHGDMDNAVECLRLGAAELHRQARQRRPAGALAETCRRTILSARTDPPLHRTPGGARRLAHAGIAGSPPGRRRGRNRGLYGPHHQKPRGGARREPLCPQAGDGVREPGVSRRRLGHARRRHFAGARPKLLHLLHIGQQTELRECLVDPVQPVRHVVKRLEGRAASLSIALQFQDAADSAPIPLDAERLEGCLLNLVGNALEAFPAPGLRAAPPKSGSRSPARPTPSFTTCGTTARG